MRGYKNFESDPHPGELRHKIEIGYTENTINENGYPAPTDPRGYQHRDLHPLEGE